MVGVPGKSKGCITCRRRKIRCDQAKPDCQKCTRTGRKCEGYEKYPTFLINTREGRQPRRHLDEVKPRNDAESSDPVALPIRSSQLPDVSSSFASSSAGQESGLITLPKHPNHSHLEESQLVSCFWDKYIPSDSSAQGPSPAPWLELAIQYKDAGPALRLSLKALALTRLGWLNNDERLTRTGRSNYGLALKHLQHALWKPEIMGQDDTLACAHFLSTYELYESTTFKAWNNHVTGLGYMIKMRGPDAHESEMARNTLYCFAFSVMIHSIQFRKSTFLNDEEWRTRPWRKHKKDLQFRLFEFGFEIGALIEKLDQSRFYGLPDQVSITRIISHFYDIQRRMHLWLQTFQKETPNAMTLTEYPEPFEFQNVRTAIVLMLYWALILVLHYVLPTAGEASFRANPEAINQPTLWEGRSLQEVLDQRTENCLTLATNILRAMPYVLKDDMGLMAAQQALFPIRVALFYLSRHGGEELQWCQEVYRQLNARKGLRYAEELSQREGNYTSGTSFVQPESETVLRGWEVRSASEGSPEEGRSLD